MVFSIYKLINPKTNEVFYVGSTRDIVNRGGAHGRRPSSAYGLLAKDYYVIENDIDPIMELIEIVHSETDNKVGNMPVDVLLVETKWIEHYISMGMPIQNKRWYKKSAIYDNTAAARKRRAFASKQ